MMRRAAEKDWSLNDKFRLQDGFFLPCSMSPPRFPVVLFERVVNQGVGADERDNPMTTFSKCTMRHFSQQASCSLAIVFRFS